jgi:hypothetical protein
MAAVDSVVADEAAGSPLRPLVNGAPKLEGAKLALKFPRMVPPPLVVVARNRPDVSCGPVPVGPLELINPSTVNAIRASPP